MRAPALSRILHHSSQVLPVLAFTASSVRVPTRICWKGFAIALPQRGSILALNFAHRLPPQFPQQFAHGLPGHRVAQVRSQVGQRRQHKGGATDYPELLANWKRNFYGWNAADFGWGADRTQNILWRLENGELDAVNPKVVVLLAGTNNVGDPSFQADADAKTEDVTRGLEAIVRMIQKKAPAATIVVMGIFPRNDNMALMPVIDRINGNLARFADGRTVRYLNINAKFAGDDGKLFEGMMNARDKLHPAVKAYQIWADALKPVLTELLGPPSASDHAPPPTGDPGASQ